VSVCIGSRYPPAKRNTFLTVRFRYVLLAATGTFFTAAWHAHRIGSFRRIARVEYPNEYATPEQIAAAPAEKKEALYLFNCAQRANANFIENYPPVLAALLIGGIRQPVLAAIAGALWTAFRIVYAVGYTLKGKTRGSGRRYGSFSTLPQLYLYGLAGWVGLKLVGF
jgi:glutathione S-transferase